MTSQLSRLWQNFRKEVPHTGAPGSRSARLHWDPPASTAEGERAITPQPASRTETRVFSALRLLGTLGSLLLTVGGLGAGALPVVNNPFSSLPLGSLMARMLHTSSALAMIGVALLVTAWLLMAPLVGIPLWSGRNLLSATPHQHVSEATAEGAEHASRSPVRCVVTSAELWRTYAAWIFPLFVTAPLFTQDIYSYLAQGSIVTHGMDPYAAGPVQLLGADNELARSVPFIWANSPAPYGPVALGISAAISRLTGDAIFLGVIAHRCIAVAGVIAAGWAITRLATRCGVFPSAALWLGILNPLAILHLIGGIHNEAVMLGFILVGMELAFLALDRLPGPGTGENPWNLSSRWIYFYCASGLCISCAGMVKVTGFIALGFTGMALAHRLYRDHRESVTGAVIRAALMQIVVLLVAIVAVTVVTGIGLGWITAQGGAATVRSWLSLSTAVGVAWGFLGMLLGLGDHTDSILTATRAAGIAIAFVFMIRMLLGTLRGRIHPLGGLGAATLVLVIFFPVVQPWYVLWALFPLAAWANRFIFRLSAAGYSAVMCLLVLPRGLGLPPASIVAIYLGAALGYLAILWGWPKLLGKLGDRVLH